MRWEVYIVGVMFASLVIGAEAAYATRDGRAGRTSALVTIFGIAAFPVAVVLHNLASALLVAEETVSFIVGVLIAPAAITLGTLGLGLALRRARPLAAVGFICFGAGLAALPVYAAVLFIDAALGATPGAQDVVQSVVLPLSLAVATAGAIVAAFALAAADQAPRRLAV